MKAPAISLQRIYEGTGPDEAYKALVDRGRGLRRADLGLDEWARDIAPSAELCKWFGHVDERWDEFCKRYNAELATPEQQARMSALLQAAGKRPLTLLYGARNTEHNRPWRCGRRCWRMRAGRRARGLIPAPPAPLFGRTRAAMPAGAIFRILNVRYARLEPRTATPQSIDGLRLQDRYARTTQGALQRYRHGNARDPVPLQKELDHVPHILQDGEQVLAFATGLMNNDTWLITLTDRRIIFLDKGMVYGCASRHRPGQSQLRLFTTRWLFGDIHIRDSSGTYQITNVWKKSIVPFTNRVQQAVDARKPANNPMPVYLVPPRYPTATRRPTRPLRSRPPPRRRRGGHHRGCGGWRVPRPRHDLRCRRDTRSSTRAPGFGSPVTPASPAFRYAAMTRSSASWNGCLPCATEAS